LVIFGARLVLLSAGIVLAFFAAHMVWSVSGGLRQVNS
jgi:hypothetical protein